MTHAQGILFVALMLALVLVVATTLVWQLGMKGRISQETAVDLLRPMLFAQVLLIAGLVWFTLVQPTV